MTGNQSVEDTKVALKVWEVAERLGVSTDKVYELVRANELPHKRIGRLIVVPNRLLLEWLHAPDTWSSRDS